MPSLRARRRRARALIALGAVIVVCALLGIMRWISFLPEMTIGSIEVEGLKKVTEKSVVERVEEILNAPTRQLLSTRNIYTYPREEIEEGILTAFPRIKSVTVDRAQKFPTTLIVKIEERTPFAQWCVTGLDCFTVDREGFIFAKYVPFVESLPETSYVFNTRGTGHNPIGQSALPGQFNELVTLMDLLGREGFAVQSATIDGEDIRLALDLFDLKVSLRQDPSVLVKNLQLVLGSDTLKNRRAEIEYIDLRFDNRVYYKLKGVVETSPATLQ